MNVVWAMLVGSALWLQPGVVMIHGAKATPVAAQAQRQAPTEQKLALVEVEIKGEDGSLATQKKLMPWNQETTVSFSSEGHTHELTITPRATPKSMEIAVTVSYDRDATAVVDGYTYDGKLWKRELLRVEGGLAIALRVVPKTIELPPPPPPRDRLQPGEGDDPLTGL